MERSLETAAEAGTGAGTSEGAANNGERHFHWNQQENRVLEQLRALYSDQEGVGNGLGVETDVVLFGSDGGFVEAHKMVLALCSPYFQDLFKKINQANFPNARNNPTLVVLAPATSLLLKHLIQFIYTGEVVVSWNQTDDFLALGSAFKIDGISYSTDLSFETNLAKPNLHEEPSPPGQLPEKLSVSQQKPCPPSPPPKIESVRSLKGNQEDVDMDISYDIYTVKLESDSEADDGSGDGSSRENEDKEEQPIASGDEDKESVSNEEEESQENDDPTYQEEISASSSSTSKRSRKDTILIKTDALSKTPQNRVSKSKTPVKISWSVQETPSDKSLKQHWVSRRTHQHKNQSLVSYYYCRAEGTRCPVRLKKTTTKDGRVIWHNNELAHINHSEPHRNAVLVHGSWSVQKAPLETSFKHQWALARTCRSKNESSITYYYCRAGGRRCPAQLKKTTTKDGRVIWQNNRMPHANHPKKALVFPGLTPEQKEFVLECVQRGVTSPLEILRRFEAEGRVPPKYDQIKGFLRHARQTPKS